MSAHPSPRPASVATGFILLCLVLSMPLQSQTARIDSLRRVLAQAKHDTVRVRAHAELCYFLSNRDNDRAHVHAREALALAKRLGTSRARAAAHASVGFFQVQALEPQEGRKNLERGLKHAIAAHDGAMTVRALRGLALAERKAGKPDMALAAYDRALGLLAQLGDSSMLGTVLAEIGHIHHLAGRYATALDAYQRAQQLFDRHGPVPATYGQRIDTGVLLHNMGQLESAQEQYALGLRLARTLKDSSAISNLLHAIGVQYARRSDNREALKYLRSCLAVRERLHNTEHIAQVYGTIGSAYMGLGELDSALVFQQRSYELYATLDRSIRGAFALANIAKILRLRGQVDTAIVLYERCRDMFEEAGDRTNYLAILGNLASAQSEHGGYANAIETNRRILEMMEQSGNRSKMPFILGNIARDHHSLGAYAESMDAGRRCLALAEELGDKESQVKALQTLAAVHLSQGRYDVAFSYLKRGLKLSEEMGNRQKTAEMHRDIGGIYCYSKRYDEALASYARSLATFEAIQLPMYTASVLRGMATVYNLTGRLEEALQCYRRSLAIAYEGRNHHARTFGEMSVLYAKRGDLDSAIVLATKAVEMAREWEDRDTETSALKYLSTHHEEKGDFANAYEFLRLSSVLRDSLLTLENLRTINEMEAKYNAAEKQRTIAQLEAEKQRQLLALTEKEKQLAVQRLEAEYNRQQAVWHAQRDSLRMLILEQRTKELKLQKLEKEKVTKERNHQASIASRETSLRNVLLLGLLLTVAVGVLSFKRVQSRRREASLQAEAAQYRMQAAKAQALAMQVEIEQRERQAQRRYAKQLIDTQERERKRIAGELHDSLGQELLVIKNRTLYALQNNTLSEQARDEFEQLERMATAALKNVRHISHDLRPYQLDRIGLTKTIRSTLQQLGEQTGLAIASDIDDIDGLFPKDDETNIYRIVQESMNNVLKHSGATTADVRIKRGEERITLAITDNGKGIGTTAPTSPTAGFGMQNMRERAEMLGGVLRLTDAPGGGAKVIIELPIAHAAAVPDAAAHAAHSRHA